MKKEILAEDYINQKTSKLLKEDVESYEDEIKLITVDRKDFDWSVTDENSDPVEISDGELIQITKIIAPNKIEIHYEGKPYIVSDWNEKSKFGEAVKDFPIVKESEQKDLTEKRHRARLIDPSKFKTFRTDKDQGGAGIDFIYGIRKKEGERGGKTELQAITFDPKKFSTKQAKLWLKRNKKSVKFTPASVKESVKTYRNMIVEKANRFMDEKFLVENEDNKGKVKFWKIETIHDFLNTIAWESFNQSIHSDMGFADPERAERVQEYADEGLEGSTHEEIIKDQEDFINSLRMFDPEYDDVEDIEKYDITEEQYDKLMKELDDIRIWHINNKSIDKIIGD